MERSEAKAEQSDLKQKAFTAATSGRVFEGRCPSSLPKAAPTSAWAHDYGCENAHIFAAIW